MASKNYTPATLGNEEGLVTVIEYTIKSVVVLSVVGLIVYGVRRGARWLRT